MEKFDFILAGGGAAGLSLALRLLQAFPHKKILILDRTPKQTNDRTWCFWSAHPSPYPSATFRAWEQLAFIGANFSATFTLSPYHYYLIRGIDFYRHAYSILNGSPTVQFEYGEVEDISEDDHSALVKINGNQYRGKWAFSSLYNPQRLKTDPKRYHYLMQHFRGWEIETNRPSFNPQVPVLFDFRTPQNGQMRFMYILPFSEREALVEYTLFSPSLLASEEYDLALHHYIEEVLKIGEYKTRTVENGVIPMSDQPLPRQLGKRILAIGTLGGRVKPSSGYAFLRIQKDSDAIINSLVKHGHPFNLPESPARYRLFDSIMLQVMLRHGNEMHHIFTQLFRNNPVKRVFGFLDEEQTFFEDVKILASLPPLPFIKALLRLKLLGTV
ncbi:MAG: lycopene cyclase [Bellilinea sp.]|nr:MAG: lycopene cyclase [Bellilinea sp.]